MLEITAGARLQQLRLKRFYRPKIHERGRGSISANEMLKVWCPWGSHT